MPARMRKAPPHVAAGATIQREGVLRESRLSLVGMRDLREARAPLGNASAAFKSWISSAVFSRQQKSARGHALDGREPAHNLGGLTLPVRVCGRDVGDLGANTGVVSLHGRAVCHAGGMGKMGRLRSV
jgi:hypothetical protein